MTGNVYAVARIRCKELALFNREALTEYMHLDTEEKELSWLKSRDWGKASDKTVEEILSTEEGKLLSVMEEMQLDRSLWEILRYPKMFHNLKALIKEIVHGEVDANLFYQGTGIDPDALRPALSKGDVSVLPQPMQESAKEALTQTLQTRDGQLCDVILDAACLQLMHECGEKAREEIVKAYVREMVATANIKIAIRACRMKKAEEFLEKALSQMHKLSKEELVAAAQEGPEVLFTYLKEKGYGEAVTAWEVSPSAFDTWCDNRLIRLLSPQKTEPFGQGPLIAYVLARESEIKSVRIISTCRQNHLPEAFITERIRETYV